MSLASFFPPLGAKRSPAKATKQKKLTFDSSEDEDVVNVESDGSEYSPFKGHGKPVAFGLNSLS